MYITCIYHYPLHKIGLKDNIFELYLYKVYITQKMMVYQGHSKL